MVYRYAQGVYVVQFFRTRWPTDLPKTSMTSCHFMWGLGLQLVTVSQTSALSQELASLLQKWLLLQDVNKKGLQFWEFAASLNTSGTQGQGKQFQLLQLNNLAFSSCIATFKYIKDKHKHEWITYKKYILHMHCHMIKGPLDSAAMLDQSPG